MTTRGELRNTIREVLASSGSFPDATINVWINAAINDYSVYIPYPTTQLIDCVAGTRVYAVTRMSGIFSVEYPYGETPPHYLARKALQAAEFYGGGYYDITPGNSLIIGQVPTPAQDILVTYNTIHTIPTQDSSVLTVADKHLDALVLFVQWQAYRELETNEALEPDTFTIPGRSAFTENLQPSSKAYEEAYRNKIKDVLAVFYTSQQTISGPWQMDAPTGGRGDRVY